MLSRNSQVCSKCEAQQQLVAVSGFHSTKEDKRIYGKEKLPADRRAPIHGVRRCHNTLCRTTWDRDHNAARNILRVFRSLIDTGDVPRVFMRGSRLPTAAQVRFIAAALAPCLHLHRRVAGNGSLVMINTCALDCLARHII